MKRTRYCGSVLSLLLLLAMCRSAETAEPKLVYQFGPSEGELRAISPNGKTAVFGRLPNSDKIWTLAKKNPRKELFHGEMILLDFTTGKPRRVVKSVPWQQRGMHGGPYEAEFSPDGKLLAVSNAGTRFIDLLGPGHVSLFDVKSGELIHEFKCGNMKARALDFSPDSRILVTSSGYSELQPPNKIKSGGLVMLWDVRSGKMLKSIKTSERFAAMNAMKCSRVFLAHTPGELGPTVARILAVPSLKNLFTLKANSIKPFDQATATSISSDGKILAVSAYNSISKKRGIQIWDVSTGKQIATIQRKHMNSKDHTMSDMTFSEGNHFLELVF